MLKTIDIDGLERCRWHWTAYNPAANKEGIFQLTKKTGNHVSLGPPLIW